MSTTEIHPRSSAAEDMRDALKYAKWLQEESQARGREVTWDAAVISGSSIVTGSRVAWLEETLRGDE